MSERKGPGESKTQHLEVILEFGHSSTLRDVPKVRLEDGEVVS